MSQKNAILAALKAGRRLTSLDALSDFNCLRLGARIWDLRQLGHDAQSEMVEMATGKRVARYWLSLPEKRLTTTLSWCIIYVDKARDEP